MNDPIVALIYDFDKTLSPRNMEEYSFFPGIETSADDFWQRCEAFAKANRTDSILTYMYLMLKESERFAPVTRESLRAHGRNLEFYPGVETWFGRINAIGQACGVRVEHYIISSGIAEIIEGSVIGDRFKAVFAGSYCYDETGRAVWPATAVNYTSKTQYLFRINKGLLDITNDRDLNAYTPKYLRRIPFSNMIYVGDGLTDVPCMKMTKQKGGYSIAVHTPEKADIADDLLLQGRADFSVESDYSEGSEIERVVSMLFRRIRVSNELQDCYTRQMRDADARRKQILDVPMRGGMQDGEESEV